MFGRNVKPPSSILYREYGSFKFLRNFSPTSQLRAPHPGRQQAIYHEVFKFKRVDEKQEEIRVRQAISRSDCTVSKTSMACVGLH